MAIQVSGQNNLKKELLSHSFLISLPVYFILDSVNKFWGFIPLYRCILLLLIICFSFTMLLLSLRRILSPAAASLFLLWCGVHYLFFKPIKETITSFPFFAELGPYKYYFLFLGFLTLLLFICLKKSSESKKKRLTQYFNYLFIVIMFIEISKAGYNFIVNPEKKVTTDNTNFIAADIKKKPNVYLLVMDEYQGTHTMKKHFGFNNKPFIDSLIKRSFFIPSQPISNYNRTSLSILALLDMSYVKNFTQDDLASGMAYNMSAKAISSNKTMQFFRTNGYKVINNSFFPNAQSGSIRELFLSTEERLLLDKTFGHVFMYDLVASVSSNNLHLFLKDGPAKTDFYNQKVIAKTKKDIENSKSPCFIYSHFMMPHFPYLRDSSGKLKDIGRAYVESNEGRNKKSYLSYLLYCNTILIDIVDDILRKDPDAIIILASDHGMRQALKADFFLTEFNNFLAVHTPGNNYNGFTDTTSLVNVFRIILNNHFRQNLPLLKDEIADGAPVATTNATQ